MGPGSRSRCSLGRDDERDCKRKRTCAHTTHCELICFACKRKSQCATATKQHDGQITSDFPKSCQGREAKIFRLTSRPNHRHNSARLTADEGRWPSSRTCGEMRWTRELQLTCVAQAYGEVVWS